MSIGLSTGVTMPPPSEPAAASLGTAGSGSKTKLNWRPPGSCAATEASTVTMTCRPRRNAPMLPPPACAMDTCVATAPGVPARQLGPMQTVDVAAGGGVVVGGGTGVSVAPGTLVAQSVQPPPPPPDV